MNINPINPNIAINSYNKNVSRKSSGTNHEESDKLELSKEAVSFMKLIESAKNSQDIRTDKVNKIKAQIDEGKYNISNNDLAKKFAEYYKNSL